MALMRCMCRKKPNQRLRPRLPLRRQLLLRPQQQKNKRCHCFGLKASP